MMNTHSQTPALLVRSAPCREVPFIREGARGETIHHEAAETFKHATKRTGRRIVQFQPKVLIADRAALVA
jgi:hypothetical protein